MKAAHWWSGRHDFYFYLLTKVYLPLCSLPPSFCHKCKKGTNSNLSATENSSRELHCLRCKFHRPGRTTGHLWLQWAGVNYYLMYQKCSVNYFWLLGGFGCSFETFADIDVKRMNIKNTVKFVSLLFSFCWSVFGQICASVLLQKSRKTPDLCLSGSGFFCLLDCEPGASHPALKDLHQWNQHQHRSQHLPICCVLWYRC